MEPEEEQGKDQEQQSPLSNASNVKGPAEKIVKEAAKTARGLAGAGGAGAATETAAATEAAAGATAGATGAGATAGATAGAAAAGAGEGAVTTAAVGGSGVLGTAGPSLGPYAAVAVILIVLLSTILLALFGNEQAVNAGTPEEPPVVEPPPTTNTDCSSIDIPGLDCAIDAPSHVKNGESYNYRFYGSYVEQEGGRELSSFILELTIPNEIIEFTTNLPGNFDTDLNGDLTTFTWLLTDPVNFNLFELKENSNPQKYTFDFSVTAKPKEGVIDTLASVEFIIYDGSQPPVGVGERCTVGSTNTCGGKYESDMSKNPDGLNFGDPNCELTTGGTINKQMVRDEIKRQLSAYGKIKDYCRWSCIATFESGYNPNSYNGNAPRAHGAWGMFQMSPWACYTSSDKPSKYNRTGNVSWREQISRAMDLQYKQLIPWQTGVPTNGYWSTYKHTCHVQPDWSSGIPCKTVRDHIIE